MKISAVLFDLDETLVADEASYREAVIATTEVLADKFSRATADKLAAAYDRVSKAIWAEFDREQRAGRVWGQGTGGSIRKECWRRALCACQITDEEAVECAVIEYGQWRRKTYQLMPGAADTLTALRPLVKLAIVTNGTAKIQREKMRLLSLENAVDYSIVAGEFGIGKPDPSIFLHCAGKLGVAPGECLVVGDLLSADIAGARNAGMMSAWNNPTGAAALEVEPDWVIGSVQEVVDIVASQATRGTTD